MNMICGISKTAKHCCNKSSIADEEKQFFNARNIWLIHLQKHHQVALYLAKPRCVVQIFVRLNRPRCYEVTFSVNVINYPVAYDCCARVYSDYSHNSIITTQSEKTINILIGFLMFVRKLSAFFVMVGF